MRIGKKLFPYPTLNNSVELSAYKNTSSFELVFKTINESELIKIDDAIILKDVCFKLENEMLFNMYHEGKLECGLIVECSSTIYREMFKIYDSPIDIQIPLKNLNDVVYISSFLYTAGNITGFSNNDFDDDYMNYKFDLEKYDIVAIDDGYKFRIDVDPDLDNKVASIFTIVRSNNQDERVSYESGEFKINIYLSPDYYGEYEQLKKTSVANNLIFGILIIPVLVRCLEEIKFNLQDVDDIEDLIEQKKWFKSICISYEKRTGRKIMLEEFKDIDPFELSQLVLNDSTCKGLSDISSVLWNRAGGIEEDE